MLLSGHGTPHREQGAILDPRSLARTGICGVRSKKQGSLGTAANGTRTRRPICAKAARRALPAPSAPCRPDGRKRNAGGAILRTLVTPTPDMSAEECVAREAGARGQGRCPQPSRHPGTAVPSSPMRCPENQVLGGRAVAVAHGLSTASAPPPTRSCPGSKPSWLGARLRANAPDKERKADTPPPTSARRRTRRRGTGRGSGGFPHGGSRDCRGNGLAWW